VLCQEGEKTPLLPKVPFFVNLIAFTMEIPKKEETQDIKQKQAAIWSQLMGIGLDFALYLALPLLAFIYAGKWLDTKYNRHFFVIIGIFIALALSWYLIFKKIKNIKDLMDKK
jgi:Putative F0F1-ATPase subunit Ca2+/Mg2+ transporter